MRIPPFTALTAFLVLTAYAAFAQTAQPSSAAASAPLPTVTLDEAITTAKANGESFKIAQDTLEASRQQLNQARANAGLSLSGTGAYSHEDNLPGASAPISTPMSLLSSAAAAQSAIGELSTNPVGEHYTAGAALSGPSTSLTLSAEHLSETGSPQDQVSALTVSGRQTLLDGYPGGREAGTLAEARDAFQASQLSYNAQLLSLSLAVKQSYYTLLNDQQTVAVQESNVEQAKEDHARVEGLLEAGEATQLDLLQAKVALGQAQIDLGSAENQVVIDRKNLSLAVGWPLDKEYRAANTDAPQARTLDMNEAIRIAAQNRPELKELDLQIASAKVALGLAKSQYAPVVSATGGVTFEHDWTASYNMGTYTAGVSVTLPIFENGLLAAKVKQAQAQLDSLERQKSQEGASIDISVESAIFSVTQSKRSLDLARQNLTAAEGQYTLESEERIAGVATNLDVLQASAAVAQARLGLEKTQNAYNLAVLNLNNSLGL